MVGNLDTRFLLATVLLLKRILHGRNVSQIYFTTVLSFFVPLFTRVYYVFWVDASSNIYFHGCLLTRRRRHRQDGTPQTRQILPSEAVAVAVTVVEVSP